MQKIILTLIVLVLVAFGIVNAADIPWSSQGSSFINPYANNGVCGIYHERAFSQDLNTSLKGLCYSGEAINLKLDRGWTWQCHVEGGVDAYCKAGRIPLTECGPANGGSFAKMNQVESVGLCNTGKATPVFRDKNDDFIWACEPLNGESSNICKAKNTSQCGYLEGVPMSVYTPDYKFVIDEKLVLMKNLLCKNRQAVAVTKTGNTFRWACGTDQCTAVDRLYEMKKKFTGKILGYSGSKENPDTLSLRRWDPETKKYGPAYTGISNYNVWYENKVGDVFLYRKDLGKVDGECGDTGYYKWMTEYYPLNYDGVMCKKGIVMEIVGKGQGYGWLCKGINGGKDERCSNVDRYNSPEVPVPVISSADNIITTGLCKTGRLFGYVSSKMSWSYRCISLEDESGQDEFNEEHVECKSYERCGTRGIIYKSNISTVVECGSLNATAIKPVSGLCEKGDPSEVTVYRNGKAWVWECLSPDRKGDNVSCYVEKLTTGQEVGLCGPSAGKNFTSKPATELCDTGIPGDVEIRDNQYRWICKGINGGRDAWCTAQIGSNNPVNAQCGPSHGQSLSSAPATGLCNSGTPSIVSGSGPWTWTCSGVNGGSNASCRAEVATLPVNAQCGPSHGQSLSSAPATGLCNSGTPSIVSGSGPWTWVCSGVNGGSNASCRAEKASAACNWTCGTWSTCINGTQTRTCTSSPSGCTGSNPYPITQPCSIGNGFCGAAHGGSFETKPTTGLCNNADMIAIGGNGPWYWICKDKNSDDANLCSATKKIVKVDGVCGSSHKGSYASAPATGLCSSGNASPVYGNGPWVWLCNGSNGGSFAVCFALKGAVNQCVSEGKSISVTPDGFNQKCCDGLVLCPPAKGVVGIMGTCKKSCEVVCNDIYAPVCGEDNKTYSNECYASVAGVGVAYQGQCLSINTSRCGKANGTNIAIAPIKDLCGDGTLPIVRANEEGDWTWKCGDDLCSAFDPNKEYKKTFGAIEMSSYSGLATSPDKAVLAIENFHCNWLPSGGVYRDYKKVSCKYESVGSHGACENCSVVVFTIEKK